MHKAFMLRVACFPLFLLFLLSFLPHLSTNFLLMAIIDRFAATCNLASPIRRIIQTKMVPLMIAFVVLTSCLFSISTVFFRYEFYGYECQTDQPIAANILYVVQTGLMQPIIMLIFVLLTYRNIRRSRRRVVSLYTYVVFEMQELSVCIGRSK